MDIRFSDRERAIATTTREILAVEFPLTDRLTDGSGEDVARAWKRYAEHGWLGMHVPENLGGSPVTVLEAALVLEEMGKVLLPGPVVPSTLGVGWLASEAGGTFDDLARSIAAADRLATFALAESAGVLPESWSTRASRMDGGWTITGEKLLVPWATIADIIVVGARAVESPDILLAALPITTNGLTVEPLTTTGDAQAGLVRLDGVTAPREECLVVAQTRALDLLCELGIGLAAYAVGAADQALTLAVEYSKNRVQFGRPIGSFQAIQHLCADALLAIQKARLLVYQAAGKRDAGEGRIFEAGLAALKAFTALREAVSVSHQVHGAIGFTLEHPAQLFSRNAVLIDVMYGDADFWADVVVDEMERVAW